MSYLETLTPAENLMLRDDGKTKLRELLKATLLDLLMKKALVFHDVVKDPDKRGRVRRYKYVEAGPDMDRRAMLAHEEVFLGPFRNANGARYLLKNLVRIAFTRSVNIRAYSNLVLSTQRMLPLRSATLLWKLFGMVRWTATGTAARSVLVFELARAEAELVPLLNAKDERARTLLAQLNGNVLLLSGLDLSLLADMELGDFDRPMKTWSYSGGCGGVGCSSFTGFDSGFDAGADAAGCGGDGGSGCGGSGCSGCGGSGCGGCGGGCS